MKSSKRKVTVLKQICKLIPGHLVEKLAKRHSVQSRTYTPWSHVVSLFYTQLWTAMTVYILLRYIEYISKWTHSSFNRLFTVLRGVLWSYKDIWALLKSYGTAAGSLSLKGAPEHAWLPGLTPHKT